MSDWVEYRVGDHLEILSGFPFESDHFSTSYGFPLIRIRDLINSNTELKYAGPYDRRWIIKKGDVLIGMDGDFALVRWKSSEALLNQRILKIDSKAGSSVLLDFFFYWFQPRLNKIHQTTAATTVKHLSIRDVAGCRGVFPNLPQQRRIAEILSTVDDAIEATEALIAKQQQIKQGLMHDLFTRGVWTAESIARAREAGSTAAVSAKPGQLRPSRETAPELYKESPLGWIPKDWEVDTIGAVVESVIDGPFGSNLKSEHYVAEAGVRVVRLQNIKEGEYNDVDRAFISESHANFLARHSVVSGDVLIAALGEDKYPVGRACCYPDLLPPAINKADCFRLRCQSHLALNAFAMSFLNTELARKQIRKFEQGVTRKRINGGNLKKVLIVLPSLKEQVLAVAMIDAETKSVDASIGELHKMKLYKQGLMQDLLTGRVSV